nr:tmv resistance protein n [Quercus suber]
MNLDELRLIDLSDSQNLIEMPDLSGAPKLKQLILQRCIRLSKIHASLGDHKQLIQLDLNGCKCLESLPHKINSEVLEIFNLGGCSRLKKFPEFVGNMSHLSELCFSETAIKHLPLSAEHLTGLTKLDLRDCKNLSSLPNACCYLMSLKILTLSGCSKINELPENLGNIKGLEELDGDEPMDYIIIPGSEIPKWFRHQSVGTSVNLQVPSDKLKGVAVCAVFVLRQHHPLHQLPSGDENDLGYIFTHRLQCYLKANGYESKSISHRFHFSEQFGKIESYHLYLGYVPYASFDPKLKENWSQVDANGLGQIEIGFKTAGPGLEGDEPMDYIIIPGSEIPKWFRHQSVGTSVNLQVPSDKLKGVAVCAVFVLRQHHPLHQLPSGDENDLAATVPVASLLMRMIWKIQQKIPKLSESHDEYDRDENGTSGEADNLFPLNFL